MDKILRLLEPETRLDRLVYKNVLALKSAYYSGVHRRLRDP
jgi:hypothetical protein